MVGCSPFPDTWWRIQQTSSIVAVSSDTGTECTYIYIYVYVCCPEHIWAVRAHNIGGHSMECYSKHDSPGPQHPPSSSQAAPRNWRTDWLDAQNEMSSQTSKTNEPGLTILCNTLTKFSKKQLEIAWGRKLAISWMSLSELMFFSSKCCCTYELNLMLHCLVADRDNTKHNAIYRFISS